MKTVMITDSVKAEIAELKLMGLYSNEFDSPNGPITRSSAHVSQDRSTIYPERNMSTGFGAGLFDNPDGNSYPSTRHTLVPIPNGLNEDQVKQQIEKVAKDGCIFRILSNEVIDVLSAKEKDALARGFIESMEVLAARHIVRDTEGLVYASYTKDGKRLEPDNRVVGKVVVDDNGRAIDVEITNADALLEYKTDVFSREYTEDVDKRKYIQRGVSTEVVVEHGELEA